MKEQIVTGKKFRILADVTSRLWHVISFWTKAQDVEFNDGTNAQSKLGNIVGISDSLTSTASNVAASAKAVKIINDKVVNQIGNLNNQISIAQEGFDAIYNALVSAGSTPSSKNPADMVTAVGNCSSKASQIRQACIVESISDGSSNATNCIKPILYNIGGPSMDFQIGKKYVIVLLKCCKYIGSKKTVEFDSNFHNYAEGLNIEQFANTNWVASADGDNMAVYMYYGTATQTTISMRCPEEGSTGYVITL